MIKKLLCIAAVAAIATAASAQDAIYLTGDWGENQWNATDPYEFVKGDDGIWSYTTTEATQCKISTSKGGWDAFNEGVLYPEGGIVAGEWMTYAPGNSANIFFPWRGEWTIKINATDLKMQFTTTTPEPETPEFASVYLRGGMNDWGVSDDWKFSTEDGNTYVLAGIDLTSDVAWKVADDSWGKINYGFQYPIGLDVPCTLEFNGSDCKLAESGEGLTFTFVLDIAELTVSTPAGLNAVVNDAAPEYYNIQGMKIANPAPGTLCIVKQGSTVTKRIF
ncbi:MAG: hypothetical protein K2N16_00045 [Muribaculaceae bacterium]|nr:hypothetical protein [Muribaculaceae bacterium]